MGGYVQLKGTHMIDRLVEARGRAEGPFARPREADYKTLGIINGSACEAHECWACNDRVHPDMQKHADGQNARSLVERHGLRYAVRSSTCSASSPRGVSPSMHA